MANTDTTNLTNFVHFNPEGTGLRGNIASISYDIDIFGEPFSSENPKAPVFKLFGKSPAARKWKSAGYG